MAIARLARRLLLALVLGGAPSLQAQVGAPGSPRTVPAPTAPTTGIAGPPARVPLPPAASGDMPRLSLEGHVVDAGRNAPIAAALVVLVPTLPTLEALHLADAWRAGEAWGALPSTRTDRRGGFALEGAELLLGHLDAATVNGERIARLEVPLLVVRAPGRAIGVFPVQVRAGGRVELGDLVMQPGAVLAGRVTDASGHPIAGARVAVSPQVRPAWWNAEPRWATATLAMVTQTDAEGGFVLDGAWPGVGGADITADGYLPGSWRGSFDAGQVAQAGVVRLQASRTLAGLARDGDGRPLAGVRVRLRLPEHRQERAESLGGRDTALQEHELPLLAGEHQTTSAADGSFRFVALPEALYDLSLWRAGLEPRVLRDVKADGQVQNVVLSEQALLVLRVVDESSGAPLPGAVASVDRCTHPPGRPGEDTHPLPLEVLTGASAARALGEAGSGDGLVVAGPAGSEAHEVSVWAPGHSVVNLSLPGVRRAAPGGAGPDRLPRLEQRVALPAGAQLSGTVTDASGAPRAGAVVRLRRGSAGLARRVDTRCDAEGRFHFDDLSAGRWQLSAFHPQAPPQPELRIDLGPGERRDDLGVQLLAGGLLGGLVVDASGQPVADHPLVLRSRGERSETTTDAMGRFRFPAMPAGEAQLEAPRAGQRAFVLGEGSRLELRLVLDSSYPLSGRVLDQDGAPTVAQLELWLPDHVPLSTSSGADGRFRFEASFGGVARLAARAAGGASAPQVVQLESGVTSDVLVSLQDARVVGQVRDGDQAIGGARVDLLALDADYTPGHAPHLELVAGDDGQFRSPPLPPGRYRVEAARHAADGPGPPVEVQVMAGEVRCELAVRTR